MATNISLAATPIGNALKVELRAGNRGPLGFGSQSRVSFPNADVSIGDYVERVLSNVDPLVISSGSTLGSSGGGTSATAFSLWVVLFDDIVKPVLGVINCLSGMSTYPLGREPLASSTAEGGGGTADSAHTFYTARALASRPYVVIGRFVWESGIPTAGTWTTKPSNIRLHTLGSKLPGDVIQSRRTDTSAVANGAGAIPFDDTIPQSNEGVGFMNRTITPRCGANVLRIKFKALIETSDSTRLYGLFRDAAADAFSGGYESNSGSAQLVGETCVLAATTIEITIRFRGGSSGASANTLNGVSSSRRLGGVANSFLSVDEIVA
jgi:hypothetical protein